VTDAQLRNLVQDCLTLWEVAGTVTADHAGIFIDTAAGPYRISGADPALRPVRWFYHTPERAAVNRPPRAAPSVVALLSALRNAMEGTGGDRLRVGGA
jgi:hypothetical protein